MNVVAKKQESMLLKLIVALLLMLGVTMSAAPAKAALRPGYYDLGGGQGVLVLTAARAEAFSVDLAMGYSVAPVLQGVVSVSLAGRIAAAAEWFIFMVPVWRIHWCATHTGAPYVYIYTIWNGVPVYADPAW